VGLLVGASARTAQPVPGDRGGRGRL